MKAKRPQDKLFKGYIKSVKSWTSKFETSDDYFKAKFGEKMAIIDHTQR